jgi:hypothetical protein
MCIFMCISDFRRDLYWMIGFMTPYTFTPRDNGQYSAIAILHTSQFTLTHTLEFSVFTSRILATDLSQSHCDFTSHMESFLNSLIPFLPLFCNWQIRRLDSIQFLCSQAHIPADWRLETRLFALDYYSARRFSKSKSKSHCD